MTTNILERLASLPGKLNTDATAIYLEPVGPVQVAAVAAYRLREKTAETAAWAKVNDLGAIGFFAPGQHLQSRHATVFAFGTAPGKAWKLASSRYMSRRGNAYTPSKTPAGQALLAELQALPPFPKHDDLINQVGAPDTINYTCSNGTSGGFDVGGNIKAGSLIFATLSLTQDRAFVSVPNVFRALARMAAWSPDRYPGLTVPDDVIDWRPPAGWEIWTNAEVELIFAEAKVKAEREEAAAKAEAA